MEKETFEAEENLKWPSGEPIIKALNIFGREYRRPHPAHRRKNRTMVWWTLQELVKGLREIYTTFNPFFPFFLTTSSGVFWLLLSALSVAHNHSPLCVTTYRR
jgi:hypothetical protein